MSRAQPILGALMLAVVMLVPPAHAVETTIHYTLPTQDCAGSPIPAGAIDHMEIYVSAGPIPASDKLCPDQGGSPDAPPATFSTKIDADGTADSATVDLFPGTYHLRARVHTAAGGWSNLSNELVTTIPTRAKAPVLINITF